MSAPTNHNPSPAPTEGGDPLDSDAPDEAEPDEPTAEDVAEVEAWNADDDHASYWRGYEAGYGAALAALVRQFNLDTLSGPEPANAGERREMAESIQADMHRLADAWNPPTQ